MIPIEVVVVIVAWLTCTVVTAVHTRYHQVYSPELFFEQGDTPSDDVPFTVADWLLSFLWPVYWYCYLRGAIRKIRGIEE